MAFSIFYPETTVSAADMNSNFQHIGNGNWLPMGGNSMENTTGAYDLGSTVYRWNNVYCNTLNVSGYSNTSTWNLVSSVTLSSTASSIEFTGLNYKLYIIKGSIIITGKNYWISQIFNDDSSSSYAETSFMVSAGALQINMYDTETSNTIIFGSTSLTNTNYISFDMNVYANPGYERFVIKSSAIYGSSTTTLRLSDYGSFVWANTSSTITSIKFYNTSPGDPMIAGTSIQLWGHA